VIAMGLVLALFGALNSASAQTTHTYSTGIQVQNLSPSVANIVLSFYAEGNGTPSATVNATVPANGSTTYATLPSVVSAGFKGSAVISSDQKIAAIVNVVGDNLAFGGGAVNGFSGGASPISLPLLFKNSFGFNTFFSVQNAGTAAADITVTYRGGGLASPLAVTANIPAGSSRSFDQATNAQLPAGFNGSASITSNQPIVAAVVEVGPTTMLAYGSFTKSSKAPLFPLVQANNFGYISGIALQNNGASATNVTVSYTPSGAGNGTACTETLNIPANGTTFFAINAFSATDPTPSDDTCANGGKFVGSARVTTNSANVDLVGIVNQLNSGANKGGSYNSFDAADATATVVLPLIQDRNFGFFTGLNIMNVGPATTVTCRFSGTTKTQTATLAANGVATLVQQGQIADKYNGSGTCTASGAGAKIVGVANQVSVTSTADMFFVYEGTNN
jgi:hypothetical protein